MIQPNTYFYYFISIIFILLLNVSMEIINYLQVFFCITNNFDIDLFDRCIQL